MSVANTITFETTYEDALQDRLDHPTTWKEMVDVSITDTRIVSSSYMDTEPSPQSVTRGTGHSLQLFSETAQPFTISTGKDIGIFMDWGDIAQSPWTKPAELFDRIGAILNEYVESAVLGQHASWTNIGDDGSGNVVAGSTPLTVSATNIDDIIRGVKTQARKANGQSKMNQYGIGFVWRPEDFELLEAFIQANGFSTADKALVEGTVEGIHYLGADHYWSNDGTSGHVFAGVKKQQRLGILRGTYGRAHTIDFPAASENNFLSGQAYYSRIDIGHFTPATVAGILYDINVT